MKLEQLLENFKHELEKEYGIMDPLVKIGIKPDCMDAVVSDLYKNNKYISYRPSEFGEFILNGVQIVPRTKDRF